MAQKASEVPVNRKQVCLNFNFIFTLQAELVEGYGIYLTQRQLDEAVARSMIIL